MNYSKSFFYFAGFVVILYSCKKITHNETVKVMVINSITGKPENNQAVSFAEYNNKPLFLNTVTQTYGETKFTDESGYVEFKDINLKCREKFRYSVNLASSDVNERFFGKTVRQEINKNEDEKIYLLEIEPTISYIEIKPKVNISFQNTYFRVSAECIAISSGLSSSYYPIVLDTVSELITQVDQRYIKGKYPMGAYKIQIVRYQNTVTDTIKKDIYLSRKEKFEYEFEF